MVVASEGTRMCPHVGAPEAVSDEPGHVQPFTVGAEVARALLPAYVQKPREAGASTLSGDPRQIVSPLCT